MMADKYPYLILHIIVFIWGFSAILGMLVALPPVELVFYRTLFSAVGLLAGLYLGGKTLRLPTSRQYVWMLGTGGLIAIHWILFFLSARISNISVCLAGMATCSLWTAFLEPIWYRKRLRFFEIGLGLLGLVGMLIIFGVEFTYWEGLVFAILSAFIASVFTIINAQFVRQGHNPYVVTFYEMLGAMLLIAAYFPIYLRQKGALNLVIEGWDWVWVLILSLVCTVYAYSISVKLMKTISPFIMNLTVNLEPVYGIILAIIIFSEKENMSIGFYLGTLLILVAVLAYPLLNRRQKRKALDNRHTLSV